MVSPPLNIGDGNVVNLKGVASGTSLEYIDASGHATYSVLQDSGLIVGQSQGAVGDPQVHQMIAAMSTFGAPAGGSSCAVQPADVSAQHVLLAASFH